ncbi:putative xyloglucan galactosyltransferase GT11 [Prunus yedoensis var. nudiflora]|uniref:Putative xyloglucan galactosyltransferase GT11 n=1 Tax=Prunus yedoensis var. nudiflora TaxID=2094558 RepID=A0A314YZ01_PRUYE|nr:putative xyloglucan galactosyltransferase GT11 [Prunus yedoensis var. nudiflora]
MKAIILSVFNDRSGDFNLRTKDVFGIQEHGIENFGQHSVSKKELEPHDHNDQARDLIENEAQSDKNLVESVDPEEHIDERVESNSDSCLGKYIYVHDIPSKFYKDLLQKCGSLSNWTNMCDFASNSGLGPHLPNFERVYSNTGWFSTNQFLLEVIFHNRMKQYNCLTKDSSQASAIFVPYYAGLDVARYLWGSNMFMRDSGGPRPNLQSSIRNEIIDQCRDARRKCKLLECTSGPDKCHKPVFVMKMFQGSVFCLQPPGDSLTRRSIFDSILAGCIPVFFHPGSAYVQYLWHLPRDYTKYSVFIPAFDIKNGRVSIERILQKIPRQKVVEMREEVIKLIPKVIYADPSSRLETLEDAFDIVVKGVLERVDTIRRDMREGKNTSFDYAEKVSWKYNLFGTVEEHEWDPFLERGQM